MSLSRPSVLIMDTPSGSVQRTGATEPRLGILPKRSSLSHSHVMTGGNAEQKQVQSCVSDPCLARCTIPEGVKLIEYGTFKRSKAETRMFNALAITSSDTKPLRMAGAAPLHPRLGTVPYSKLPRVSTAHSSEHFSYTGMPSVYDSGMHLGNQLPCNDNLSSDSAYAICQ